MVGGGGGSDYIYLFFLGGEGGRGTLLFCVYSNAFVCLPIHSCVFGKKIETQFIRMSSNSLGGVATPEPGLLFRGSFVCLPIHGIGWGYPPPNHYILLFRGNNNNESKSIHYYYFREIIIIMVRGGRGVLPAALWPRRENERNEGL